MTTAAAMLAGVPLAFGHGTGSELRQPLGYAMVGGLALSQVLTLYTTPVVYLYLDRVQSWLNRGKRAPAHEPEGDDRARAAASRPSERGNISHSIDRDDAAPPRLMHCGYPFRANRLTSRR